MAFDPGKMDAAAHEAADEWEKLIAETQAAAEEIGTTEEAEPSSEPTAFELVKWLRKYRNTAGYKPLVKWLFEYYGV